MKNMANAIEKLINELENSGIFFMLNEPMRGHTTFAIGGDAAVFAVPKNMREICTILHAVKKYGVQAFVLGKGSNVLFSDEPFNGVVLHVAENFSDTHAEGEYLVAGTGAALSDVCVCAQENSLAGLEFAYGIPGSVGGAVYMNAGAYGGEMSHVLHSVTAISDNCEVVELPVSELQLGYRRSVFQDKLWCILWAKFALKQGDKDIIKQLMDENMGKRIEKQPLELPSAGSAFKRPQGAFAGQLIDSCGLRGLRVGDAAISEKHCGFIVNLGSATCKDVLTLAQHVADVVKEQTGFILEKEIRVVGNSEA